MAIKIDFLANVRNFLRGTDDADEALDEVADSLDDMSDAAKKGGRDAERSVEKLEGTFRDAARRAKDLGDAGKDAGKDVAKGMDRAEEGVDDFKSEAAQTARETAASFDGSFESIADMAQETAANAFAGFGPAGAAAGVAVASAIGVIVQHFTKVTEAADEARESAHQMAFDVAGALDAAGYSSRIQAWTEDQEKLKQVRDLAIASGWDEVDVIDALASGGDKLEKLTDAYGDGEKALELTNGRLWELEAVLKATGEGFLSGEQAAKLGARALYEYAQKVGTATGETDDLGNAIYELPDKTEVVVDANTGRAYENVDQLESKIGGLKDKSVSVNVRANLGDATEQYDRWIREHDGRSIKIRGKVITPEMGWG